MQVLTQFTFHSEEEYIAFCKHMAKVSPAATPAAPPQPTANQSPAKDSVPAPTQPKKETKTETKKEAAPPKAESEEVESDENELTFENVKNKILSVAEKTKTNKQAVAILKKYGATKVDASLDEKHYAAVIEDCNVILEA